MTSMCGPLSGPPHGQCGGALGPTSPSLLERLSSVMPERNSSEKPARTSSDTPRDCRPSRVKATCSAVSGGTSSSIALVTGAEASHDRAAEASRMLSSQKDASVSLPYPKRAIPWISLKSTCALIVVPSEHLQPLLQFPIRHVGMIKTLTYQHVALHVEITEPRKGVIPDLGRQFVPANVVLKLLLIFCAIENKPVSPGIADAVAEHEV